MTWIKKKALASAVPGDESPFKATVVTSAYAKNADETSEVSTQSGSMQTNPTFSREDLGAALTAY